MSPVIYVIKVKDHPEFPVDNVVAQDIMSAAGVYVRGYRVPDALLDNLLIFDAYAADMYQLIPKDE